MYIVSPMTSGEASWLSRMPICSVHATCRFLMLLRLIWSSAE
jgi:hypothetical protein